MVLSKTLTTREHGSFRVFAQIKRGVSDPLAGCTMIRQIIRTRDYENMERAKVAAHTIRLVLAVCSRKTIEPREMAQKYITKCRQIVGGNQQEEHLDRARRFVLESLTEEELAGLEVLGTLDGDVLSPYSLIRLLSHELRQQHDPARAIFDTLDKMHAMLPHLSAVECSRASLTAWLAAHDITVDDLAKAMGRVSRTGRIITNRHAAIEKLASDSKLGRAAVFSTEADDFIDAVVKKQLGVIKSTVRAGINIDCMHTLLLYTGLHGAADFGHLEVVKLLVSHGANVNARDVRQNRTPLHYCAEGGHLDICLFLLTHGANRALVDQDGRRPSDLANSSPKIKSRKHLVEILSDVPGRVPAVTLQGYDFSSLSINWAEPLKRRHQVPIDYYQIEWRVLPDSHSVVQAPMLATLVIPNSDPATDADPATNADGPETDSPVRWALPAREDWCRATTSQRSFTIGNLLPATEYQVRIVAHNAAGLGLPSCPARLHTQESTPTAPSAPKLIHRTPTTLTLIWQPPERENGFPLLTYELQRCNVYEQRRGGETSVSQRTSWQSEIVPLDQCGCHVSRGIIPFGKVAFRVRANNQLGWGLWSQESAVLAADESVRVTNIAPRSLTLHWDTHPDPNFRVFGYELQVCNAEAMDTYTTICSTIPRPAAVGHPVVYDVNTLLPAKTYYFRVRQLDENGWQHWTHALKSAAIKTQDDRPEPPQAPFYVIRPTGDYGCALEWVAGEPNGPTTTRFEVLQSEKEGEWQRAGESTEPELIVHNLRPGRTYLFRVRALNSVGWSEFSPVSEAFYVNLVPCPSGVSLAASGLTWLDLRWQKPAADLIVQRYEVRVRHVRSNTCTYEESDTEQLRVTSLRPRGAYRFSVRAMTMLGWSAWSQESDDITFARRL